MLSTKNILQFLTELSRNNNREWFQENKAWYDRARTEFDQMVATLITEIAKFDEEIKFLSPKECTFRIYRDIRFSPNKIPYKTHFGAYIAANGGRKSPRGGYYLHLEPGGSFLSVGVWMPEPNVLKALRQSVYDNIDELSEIRSNPEFARYYTKFYDEDALKKIPQGFPKDFPEADLLKLKHYLVDYSLNDEFLSSNNFISKVLAAFKAGYSFNRFFNYTVDEQVKPPLTPPKGEDFGKC